MPLLVTEPSFGVPGYVSPYPAPVLAPNPTAYEADSLVVVSGDLVTPGDFSTYATTITMYSAGFYGDYYNRVFLIPPTMTLVDPAVNSPNRFYFWSTFEADITLASISGINNTGLSFDPATAVGLNIRGIKLTQGNLLVGVDAPSHEDAVYTFGFSNSYSATWHVSLIRTNLLAVPPDTSITETLKWKTDVIPGQGGTEQRISLTQFPRIEHALTYTFLDDSEILAIYEQYVATAPGLFAYPLWAEQTRLMVDAPAGSTTLQIDTTKFDLVAGDSIYLENDSQAEQIRIDSISPLDHTTCTLTAGIQNSWTKRDHLYRITQVRLPAKTELQRFPWGHVESKPTLRFTEFRDLFSADAATVEIGQATLLGDRVLTTSIYTLSGIPILHARPIVDASIKEGFDWNFEVMDFDTGAFDYLTNRNAVQPSLDRKFYIKNRDQKFYWNWILKWLHGQRKPVWLPTWVEDFGDTILSVTGHTVIVSGEKYLAHYPADSPYRGIWFTWNGQWFPRAITDVSSSGDGNTQITLSADVPVGFPTTPPYDAGFMILARQATDEVQRELHPAYSFLTTSFIGTKATPEAP